MGLDIKHGQTEGSVLHPQVDKMWICLPEDPLIQMVGIKTIMCLKTYWISEEREMMLVTSAQNNGIKISLTPVTEMNDPLIDASEKRNKVDSFRPF